MLPNQPPRWADRLLDWFCAPHLLEEVQGDLYERFLRNERLFGLPMARRQYAWEVITFLRPFALKRQPGEQSTTYTLSPAMIRNYLTVAWRNLLRNKTFAAINITGLAVGLATCLMIMLYVMHELSYDRYHAKADRMYRMTIIGQVEGKALNIAYCSVPAGPTLANDYPGVEAVTRVDNRQGTFIVTRGTESFKEEHVAHADSNFFDTFSIPLLKGRAGDVLTQPNTVVLNESTARKYFGNEDPVGQTITLGTLGLYRVTGVFKDIPSNTHFHYNIIGSLRSLKLRDTWLSSGIMTYIVLRPNFAISQLEARIPEMVRKHISSEMKQLLGVSLSDFQQKGNSFRFGFQPITDIHLHSHLEEEAEPNGDLKYVYIFSVIAVFILLLACINFMNLSTAGSAKRAREVGVRKVLGSHQGQLIGQFLSESMLVTFMALVIALGLVFMALPVFNQLAGTDFTFSALLSGRMIPAILLSSLLIGLLAGSYPAFFLSSFKPVSVLKGRFQTGARSGWLRHSLVTVQFMVSIGMIIGTLIVYRQLHFIQHKKVGFDKEQVLMVHDTYTLGDKTGAFKSELRRLAQVVDVTSGGYMPAGPSNHSVDGIRLEDGNPQATLYREKSFYIDDRYIHTLGIALAQGRNFLPAHPADQSAVLLNEAAVKRFGFKQPVGQQIWAVGDGSPNSQRRYTVVGVLKDFHFESMHEAIAPLIMFYGEDNYQMAIRIRTDKLPELLKTLETIWKAQTNNPFAYSFLNERFNAMYQSEERVGKLFGIFAGLTIFVACLGLFGLAAFTAQRRTKEIGVRKVLGASVASVVVLLSRDFLKPVLIALVIATPVAWYGMHQWLQDFAYRINVEWWVFALAGALAIAIALLTVSFQSIKAALVNPVKSLKTE